MSEAQSSSPGSWYLTKPDWFPSPNYNFVFKDDSVTWWQVYIIQVWSEKFRIWTARKNMKNLKIVSFGSFCPIVWFFLPDYCSFCPRCSWKCLVVDKSQPDLFINSGLQFRIKLEIPRVLNQYSGNKMRHEPAQSLQNMSFTTNTRQACHSLANFWVLNYSAYCWI